MNALVIKNIHKTFDRGTPNEKKALNGISFSIEKGEFVTVIGGNGSGKSTLFNAIAGLWPIDCGTIEIEGIDVTSLCDYKRAKYLGRVFQDPMLGTVCNMTIIENLALSKKRGEKRTLHWGITNKDKKEFQDLLSSLHLGLEDRLYTKIGLLSGGQRQAISLLMATLKKPKVLLLDEHTAALDPHTAKRVLELTDKIIKEHSLTAFMVTHNMSDALEYGNKIIMMDSGNIVYKASGEQKRALKIDDLLSYFHKIGNKTDKVLLS